MSIWLYKLSNFKVSTCDTYYYYCYFFLSTIKMEWVSLGKWFFIFFSSSFHKRLTIFLNWKCYQSIHSFNLLFVWNVNKDLSDARIVWILCSVDLCLPVTKYLDTYFILYYICELQVLWPRIRHSLKTHFSDRLKIPIRWNGISVLNCLV